MPYLGLLPRVNLHETQQRMLFAPQRSSCSTGNLRRGTRYPSKEPLGDSSHKLCQKESEVSTFNLKDPSQRCILLPVFTNEDDTQQELIAPSARPIHVVDHRNSLWYKAHVKLDSFKPISPPPSISLGTHCQQDCMCCAKSFISTTSPAANDLSQSQHRTSNERTEASMVSNSSCQLNCDLSGDSSISIHGDSNDYGSIDLVKDSSKVDKPMKKNSRKKLKKQQNQHKKPVSSCSVDLSVGSTETNCFFPSNNAEHDISSKFCEDKLQDSCLQACNQNERAELGTYFSHIENGKLDHTFGSILQKLIPNGRKDAEALENLSNSNLDVSSCTGEEKLNTESNCYFPASNADYNIGSKFCEDKLQDSCLQACNQNERAELGTCFSHIENRKLDHVFGSILQKLIPNGRKDAEALENLSNSHLDVSSCTEEEKLNTESNCYLPASNAEHSIGSKFCEDKLQDTCLQACNQNERAELGTCFSHIENGKLDQVFGSILQKLIPNGRKDAEALENLSNSHLDVSSCTKEEKLNTESNCHVCFTNAEFDISSKFCKDRPGDSCLQACRQNAPVKVGTCLSRVENNKLDRISGSILQKLIPNGRKDSDAFNNLLTGHLDDPKNSKCTIEERLNPSSGNVSYILNEDDRWTSKLRYHAPGISRENNVFIHKLQEKNVFVNMSDLSKITEAVNDAYTVQNLSEGVQSATGNPLAEIERFLYSASPAFDRTCDIQHCDICSGDKLIGGSLCRHQIPNVSLGSVWQWYERPGSYGLEVKVEEYQTSKRHGSDRVQFHAYFVPFLSAVQFFGHSSSIRASDTMPNAEFMKTHDVDATSQYSYSFNYLPIFSLLIPRPCREKETDTSSLSTPDFLSVFGQDKVCKQSVSSVSDSELIFEYFESEQPQQRRPLFEKIQDLVRGNATSNCQIFGDPLKLECLQLHDLHPSSWYSVAWYPIYRIPDANFHATFLTYHSLGHFIHRSAQSDSPGEGVSIVSPVVGLQSYNAQDVC